MSKKLKACPFCGRENEFVWLTNDEDSAELLVGPHCSCGAAGPKYPTQEEAIVAWNARPTQSANSDLADELINSPPVTGEPWIERWCGSGMWKGSSIWTADSLGCHKNMIEHFGGDEETHASVRRIVAAHNAALRGTPDAEIDICQNCNGSGSGVADTTCWVCDGSGGVVSSEYRVEGSIYEGMEAAITQENRTIAHCAIYGDAVALVAALRSAPDVARAELLWANLPVQRQWTDLSTHEKVLVCHQVGRLATEASKDAEIERLREALERIKQFGHGDGHGRGYTCADMAADALGSK